MYCGVFTKFGSELWSARGEGIDATLEKHKVDAIVAPTAGPAWLTDWINGDQASKTAAVLTACKSRSRLAINEFSIFDLQLAIGNPQ
jgi:amidase